MYVKEFKNNIFFSIDPELTKILACVAGGIMWVWD